MTYAQYAGCSPIVSTGSAVVRSVAHADNALKYHSELQIILPKCCMCICVNSLKYHRELRIIFAKMLLVLREDITRKNIYFQAVPMPGFFGPLFYSVVVLNMAIFYSHFTVIVISLVIFFIIIIKFTIIIIIIIIATIIIIIKKFSHVRKT